MTFNEMVDLVLLHVNGGSLASDAAVQRSDVETYLPSAILNAFYEWISMERALSRREGRAWIAPESVYAKYEFTATAGNPYAYVLLPGRIAELPIVGVSSLSVDGQSAIYVGSEPVARDFASMGMTLYWIESGVDAQSKVYINKKSACPVSLKAILVPSCDSGDDQLQLPDGIEVRSIEIAKAHFTGQRSMPDDAIVDENDVNANLK